MAPISAGCAPVSKIFRQRSEDLVKRGLLQRSSSIKEQSIKGLDEEEEGCKTPKSKEFRMLPEESLVCPPAPKKPHLQLPHRHLLLSPPKSITSPELELFFKQLEVNAYS